MARDVFDDTGVEYAEEPALRLATPVASLVANVLTFGYAALAVGALALVPAGVGVVPVALAGTLAYLVAMTALRPDGAAPR